MEHLDSEIVEFSFIIKPTSFGSGKAREVRGTKTLKLFKSWFRLAKNTYYPPYNKKNQLIYGVLKFETGETWLWQPESDIRHDKYWHGGWQRALSAE